MSASKLKSRFVGTSIARRLFVSAAIWILLILVAAGYLMTAYYRSLSEAAFDERLNVYLRALVADVATSGDDQTTDAGALGDPQFELILSGWYWQITRTDTEKPEIRASRSLFSGRLPKLGELGFRPGPGGARSGVAPGPDGVPLRIVERTLSVGDAVYLVQVAAVMRDLEAQIMRFEIALTIAFALLGSGLLAATAFQVAFGLGPLRRLRSAIGAVRIGAADHIAGDYPDEIQPVAEELNLMIASNREVVERARTQVGNLAHALKTPMSVIQNEIADEAGPLPDKIRTQMSVMRDQIGYYLDRARAAARAGSIGESTEIAPALEALQRTFRKIARERDIAFDNPEHLAPRFLGERQDFDELVGNLLDNACKWARHKITLSLAMEPAAAGRHFAVITICDDGPGLPEEQRAAAVQRGRRLDESKPGSGLGLSIVSDLAGAYGGALELGEADIGGLKAVLRLPAVAAGS